MGGEGCGMMSKMLKDAMPGMTPGLGGGMKVEIEASGEGAGALSNLLDQLGLKLTDDEFQKNTMSMLLKQMMGGGGMQPSEQMMPMQGSY